MRQVKISRFLLAGLFFSFAGAAGAAEYEPSLRFPASGPGRTVALTLDACAGGFDRRIFDTLVQSKIKATIFVTKRWLDANPRAFAEIKAHPDLFQVENHGAMHVPAVTGSPFVYGIRTAGTVEAVRAEVEGGANAIQQAGAGYPRWYRGATARYSGDAMTAIKKLNFRIAGYSLNADGGASLPAGEVVRRLATARSGDVIIGHINQPNRPAGAGMVEGLKDLQASGARFVRLDDVAPQEKNDRPTIDDTVPVAKKTDETPKPAGEAALPGDEAKPRPKPDRGAPLPVARGEPAKGAIRQPSERKLPDGAPGPEHSPAAGQGASPVEEAAVDPAERRKGAAEKKSGGAPAEPPAPAAGEERATAPATDRAPAEPADEAPAARAEPSGKWRTAPDAEPEVAAPPQWQEPQQSMQIKPRLDKQARPPATAKDEDAKPAPVAEAPRPEPSFGDRVWNWFVGKPAEPARAAPIERAR